MTGLSQWRSELRGPRLSSSPPAALRLRPASTRVRSLVAFVLACWMVPGFPGSSRFESCSQRSFPRESVWSSVGLHHSSSQRLVLQENRESNQPVRADPTRLANVGCDSLSCLRAWPSLSRLRERRFTQSTPAARRDRVDKPDEVSAPAVLVVGCWACCVCRNRPG